jgi:hypothetical protein
MARKGWSLSRRESRRRCRRGLPKLSTKRDWRAIRPNRAVAKHPENRP